MISIIIPIYNTPIEFIQHSFLSINNQTFDNYEVLVIDDGSSDSIRNFLVNFEKENPKYKILSKKHEGISQSLNLALKIAKNNIIARMDADDIMLPTRLEKQYKYFISKDVDILGCQLEMFDNITNKTMGITNHKEIISLKDISSGWFVNHPTVFLNRDKINAIGGYDPIFNGMEDLELWCRSLANGLKIQNMKDVLLLYRRHTDNASAKEINNPNFQLLKNKLINKYLC